MVYRFTDVVIDSRTGLNPRKNFVLGGGDNYYITIKDIYNGKVNLTDKTDKVDDEAIQIIKRRSRIKAGDVLFVSIGRIGETAIVTNKDDSWDVNESVFVFTLNDKIITPEYFCTMFQSQGLKQYLSGNSSGSTFKSIKMNQLERMTFDLPPVTTQKSITTKLTAVRRIIDLRTSQLAELNNLVKARFVEMFGDPLHNTKDLQTSPMTNICRIIDGDRGKNYPKQEDFSDCGFCLFLNAKNVTAQGFSFENCMYITEEKDALLHNGKLCRGDVVLTTRGTIGNLAFYDTSVPYSNVRINSGMVILRMNRNLVSEIFFMEQFKMQLDSIKSRIASGSAQPQLPISTMNKIKMILPQVELQNQFEQFVKQVDKSKAVEGLYSSLCL